jgi:protease I
VHKAAAPRNVRTAVNGARDAEPPEGIHAPGLGVSSRGRPTGTAAGIRICVLLPYGEELPRRVHAGRRPARDGNEAAYDEAARQAQAQAQKGQWDIMRIAFLTAPEGVEQVELTDPWQALVDAGHEPVLVSTKPGHIQAFKHLEKADTFPVDAVVGQVEADSFDGLVLPGGVANPDFLRMDERAVEFVRDFFGQGRPVAAICHAPWTLVEADVVRGRTLTSWPSLRTDIGNAGGTWVDEQVRVDHGQNTLVTSRKPGDLKAFDEAILTEFAA